MGFLKNQFSSLVEWNESDEGVIFSRWPGQEIKKGSRLIIRPGQDAVGYSAFSDHAEEFQVWIQHTSQGGGAFYQYEGTAGEMGDEECH